MLIIAIPKSASTSLLDTIGKLHKKDHKQLFFKDLFVPKDFEILGSYHSDIREFDAELINIFCNKNNFYKQHIPPTRNNIDLLEKKKKVILLRKPLEIIEAYWRAEQRKVHDARKEFIGFKTKEEWNKRADEIGLINEVEMFFSKWQSVQDGNTLHISYEKLISDPKGTINEIELFFDLPVSNNIILSKKRYTHHNILLNRLELIKRYLGGLKRSLFKRISK